MMASKMLSRLLPVAEGDVSVYDSSRHHEGMDLESQRRRHDDTFYDEDDVPADMLYEGSDDHEAFRDVVLSPPRRLRLQESAIPSSSKPKWFDGQSKRRKDDDEDVPESLLLESQGKMPALPRPPSVDEIGTGQAKAEAQWKATQKQHKLHASQLPRQHAKRSSRRSKSNANNEPVFQPNPEADAMWLYTNATNVDGFLRELYQYYTQHGVYSILLGRAIEQLSELFIISFAIFLTTCIDFSKISKSKSTSEILIPKCMAKAPWYQNVAIFCFVIHWFMTLTRNIGSARRLFQIRDFYTHVLCITDEDLQTVSWVRVVDGLVKVQNANVATANNAPQVKRYLEYNEPQQRMNAETIANRLMRQDNYYVAMFNKDIFDFTLPIPGCRNRQFYSKSLEWCIDFCLTNFIFDEQGTPRPFALDVKNRRVLVDNLRRRLQFAAVASIIFAPWNIIRFCVTYFFRYYTEFTRNPSKAGARSFTPFAEWKIREFNELEHLFQRRIRLSYPAANDYLKQFPKDKLDQLCRFVAFISGAIAAVITLFSALHSEVFLSFEITPGATAVIWLGTLLTVFGVASGMLPDDYETHEPVLHLKEVLLYTHYMPAQWKNRLHSNEVKAEFSALYQVKLLIFAEEMLSLVLAPMILLRNANTRSERIIDFFREHTVHVDGVGNQCNFAVFGFKKNQNIEDPSAALQEPDGLRDDYYGLKDDKMAASVQNFHMHYSHHNLHQQQQRRRMVQAHQPPPAWPPMSPPPAIAEDFTPPAARNTTQPSRAPVSPQQLARGRGNRGLPSSRHPPSLARTPSGPTPTESTRFLRSGAGGGVSESRLMAQDSDLDDYDKAVGPAESDAGVERAGADAGREGVLGMLAQFTKARAEKGGVEI